MVMKLVAHIGVVLDHDAATHPHFLFRLGFTEEVKMRGMCAVSRDEKRPRKSLGDKMLDLRLATPSLPAPVVKRLLCGRKQLGLIGLPVSASLWNMNKRFEGCNHPQLIIDLATHDEFASKSDPFS